MRHDIVNDAIVNIKNHEHIGKKECILRPLSKVLIEVLKVFQADGFIGEFEVTESTQGGSIKVTLNKRINDCGIIKPRYAVKADEFDLWEKRYLPARDFGTLVVSTPKGILSHRGAKKSKVGGRLIAYVY